jgi:hopanoid biosynthesis associated RND transporter like protein HpnN
MVRLQSVNPVQKLLRKILLFETGHPWICLFIALVLTALSLLFTVRNLEFQTSQKDLISRHNRLIALDEVADQFSDLDTFVVAIENRDTSRSLAFLKTLAPLLEADHAHYQHVFYRVDPERFKPWALLYLDKKDLLDLRDKLQEHHTFMVNLAQRPSLTNFFRQINHEMASRMVGELFTGFLTEGSKDHAEPVDLTFLIRTLTEMRAWLDGEASFHSPWGSFFSGGSWGDDPEEGYFWTENKRYLLVLVTPRKEGNRFADAQDALTALRTTIAQVQERFPDIQAGVTGQEALNEDEMGAALKDMSLATAISLVGLTVLLVLFWRGFRRPLLEMTELIVALSLTFGLTTLFIGHLNILSVTFAPLLLGLGIDYGIHWFARYQEEEQRRRGPKKEAIETTMVRLGPGILLAGLTAALSFFPLVLTGFKGLAELGIICSMGMVITTLTTLCLLPALTMIFDRSRAVSPDGLSGTSVKPFFVLTNPRAMVILIFAAVGLGLSSWGAQHVRFDLNMLRLQSQKAESVVWEKKLIADSERSSLSGAILTHSLDEVREKTKALEALPSVSEVQSVESLLPENQEEKIAFLRRLQPILAGVHSFEGREDHVDPGELDDVFGKIRFKMMDSSETEWGANKPLEIQMLQVRRLIDQLRERFRTTDRSRLVGALHNFERALLTDLNDKLRTLRTNMTGSPMQIQDLPKPLRQRFTGKGRLYLIRVFPAHDVWEPANLERFVQDLRSVDPDAVGDPVTLYTFTKAFRDACLDAAVYAVIFIVLLLLLTFRNVVHAALAMVPLVVGTLWTMGLMRALDVDFNLANSIFLPLVVGAGVEYGIIILQRLRQNESDVVLPFSTAKGIVLAGLTTTIGFGSLRISNHHGIQSLGLLAMVGSISILAAAVFFLPALLQILRHFPKDRG